MSIHRSTKMDVHVKRLKHQVMHISAGMNDMPPKIRFARISKELTIEFRKDLPASEVAGLDGIVAMHEHNNPADDISEMLIVDTHGTLVMTTEGDFVHG